MPVPGKFRPDSPPHHENDLSSRVAGLRYRAATTFVATPPFPWIVQPMPQSRPLAVPALCVFALAIVASVGAHAQAQDKAPPARSERAADHRALSDSVRRVERETNGQVLSAERVQFDGRDVNRVKIIDNS